MLKQPIIVQLQRTNLPLRRFNRPPTANFLAHAQPHHQSAIQPRHMVQCIYRKPFSHTTSERKKRSVFGAEQFYEHNATALGAVRYNRVLPSRDGTGRSPLASRRATRTNFVHFPTHALHGRCTWNAAVSLSLTMGRVQTSGGCVRYAY